jgi:dihydroflavonol-4-reductase
MKIVVTGANGFLGSWLTKALVYRGFDVHILVRPTSDLSDLAGITYKILYGDVTDLLSLEKAFEGASGIFHLAGVVAYRYEDRPQMEKVNVGGTKNVIAAAEKMRVPKILHLSSVVAVGASKTPEHILNEDSPYTISDLNLGYFETKRTSELLVKAAFERGAFDAIIVNPSTIYGAADAKKGSRSIQVKVAQGKFPFYTPGGASIVGVEDVVDGIIKAWDKGRPGERYILSHENWTVQSLFETIANEAGVEPPKHKLPASILHTIGFLGDAIRPLGIKGPITRENAWTSTMFHWFDNSKARRELGFNPRPATEAIHKSVAWMKENGLLSK